MAYIGTPAVDRFTASKAASVYSGNGSTVAFTLEHAVGSDEDILVSVDGVIQEPSVAYAVSVGTTLTFTAAPSSNSGNNIFVYYLFRTLGTVAHPATSALSATTGTFSSNATVGGTLAVTGVPTFTGRSVHSGGITIANAGQIGSVGDADAMAISSSGVVTFSQPPVGAGGLVKLYTQSGTSAVTSIDIDDTYINSTYDTYYVVGHCLPATDNVDLYLKLKDSSGIITGSKHGYDLQYLALGEESQGGDFFKLNYSNVGNVAGEGSQFSFHIYHVNSTTVPCTLIGGAKTSFTDGNPEGIYFTAGLISTAYATVVKGFNLVTSSGNIASNNLTIYGIVK